MKTGFRKTLVTFLTLALVLSSFISSTTLVSATPIMQDTILALRYDTEVELADYESVRCDVILRVDMSADSGTLMKDGVEINWPGSGFVPPDDLGPSTKDFVVTVPGVYVASVTNEFLTTTVHFTIDRTGPGISAVRAGTEIPVLEGAYTKYDVEMVVESETENTVTLDGESIDWPEDATFAEEGEYYITSSDEAGNVSSFYFTIDKTGPTIYLVYSETGVTLGPVKVSASTDEPAMLNFAQHIFFDNGWFGFMATDRAGNVTVTSAYVDNIKTYAPTIHAQVDPYYDYDYYDDFYYWYADDLYDDDYVNETVYVWTSDDWFYDSNVTVHRNGSLVNSGSRWNTDEHYAYYYGYYWSYSTDGHYTVTAWDDLGNTSDFHFVIDTVHPVIHGVTDGARYGTSRTISAFDDQLLDSLMLNGEDFTNGGTVSEEGTYTIEAVDAAGNHTTYDFVIDMTAPTVDGVSNGSYYKTSVSATFETGATAKLNNASYTSGTTISAEGVYTLIVTDSDGNVTRIGFVIDKTAPSIWISYDPPSYNVESWYDRSITAYALFADAYLSGDSAESHVFYYNGQYTFYAYDLAGNEASRTVTIGNIEYAPLIHAYKPSNDHDLASGDRSNDSVQIDTEYAETVTVTFVGRNGSSCNYTGSSLGSVSDEGLFTAGDTSGYWNGAVWTAPVYRDGTYTVTATSPHGFVSTFTFILDSAYPRITINPFNEDWTNGSVVVTAYTEDGATLNTTRYVFTENGEFTFVSTDELGNSQSNTVEIDNIDKEAFLDAEAYDSDDEYLHDVVDHEYTNCAYIRIRTENWFRFRSFGFEPLFFFAPSSDIVIKDGVETDWPINGEFIVEGSYVVTTTDWLGNVSTIHFVIDRTDPAVSGVADGAYYKVDKAITVTDLNLDTITLNGDAFTSGSTVSAEGDYTLVATDKAGNSTTVEFTIDKTAPGVSGVADGAFYKVDRTITVTDLHLSTITLDGSTFTSGSTVSDEGDYTLIATDLAGNTTTVDFTIDKTAPEISGAVEGTAYNTNRTITATDANLDTITLNGSPFTSGSTVSADGEYTVVATDKAGNSSTLSFAIDKTAPVVTGAKSGTVTSVVSGTSVHFDVVVTVASDSVVTTAKRNGTSMTWPTGGLFTVPGTYVVTAADELGNLRTYTFVILKPIIVGKKVYTSTVVPNGGYSNKAVTVTITGYKYRSVKRNGVAISWPSGNTFWSNGSYMVTATDSFGARTTYSFVVHNLKPSIYVTTSGGTRIYNGGSTTAATVVVRVVEMYPSTQSITLNGNVVTWPANGQLTAKGVYVITVTDLAGNTSKLTFTKK